MISQTTKKIYIIGTNPLDISDCTLYALKKIKDSNLIIIPKKFKKNFINTIKLHHHHIIYEEDLSITNGKKLWKKISKLLSLYEVITHLVDGDPYIDGLGYQEFLFFNNHKFDCEIIPGVVKVVDCLNLNSDLLTDRDRNSSVTFVKQFNKRRVANLFYNFYFEKLLIFLKHEKEYDEMNEILLGSNKKNKFTIRFPIKNKLKKLNLNYKQKGLKNLNFPTYIIIDNGEKT